MIMKNVEKIIESDNIMREKWVDLIKLTASKKMTVSDYEYWHFHGKDKTAIYPKGTYFIETQINKQFAGRNYIPVTEKQALKFIEISEKSIDDAVEAMEEYLSNQM